MTSPLLTRTERSCPGCAAPLGSPNVQGDSADTTIQPLPTVPGTELPAGEPAAKRAPALPRRAAGVFLGCLTAVLGLLYFAYGLMLLTNPRRGTRLPAHLHEWTTFVPGRAILPYPPSVPVTSFITPAFPTMKRTER